MLATAPIANVRTAELRCADRSLGLHAIHYRPYRDSGRAGSTNNRHPAALSSAPVEEIAARIATLLRAFRPEVVVTHCPHGGCGQPDHLRVHDAVVAAWRIAGEKDPVPHRQLSDLAP